MAIGFVGVAAFLVAGGWLLGVTRDARADVRSGVIDRSVASRLAWSGVPATAMESPPVTLAMRNSSVTAERFPAERFPDAERTKPERPKTASRKRGAQTAQAKAPGKGQSKTAALDPLGALASVLPGPPGSQDDLIFSGSLGAPTKLASLEPMALPMPRPARGEMTVRSDEPPPLPRSKPVQLASLTPPDELPAKAESESRTAPRTAIYDIRAQVVYMPNGERLEAHSGLGRFMDDPTSMRLRMRGVTPPNTYQLKLRESLFHGVQAIRLTPLDDGAMFDRDGILAHTYMLGPNGQSNGCVSFKEYPRFLHAFLRGEVDRLVVVPHLSQPPAFADRRSIRGADRSADNRRDRIE